MSERIVCCADLHLRPDKPACRAESQEDWISLQMDKLSYILNFAYEHDADVVIAGDICHRATGWPSWMFSRVINTLSNWNINVYGIPGQHDLPYHQLSQLYRSNLGVLIEAALIEYLRNSADNLASITYNGFPWGVSINEGTPAQKIAVAHMMVLKDRDSELWPGQIKETGAGTAEALLRKFPQYKLIVTGDNHQPFAVQFRGRWLVNPGSMTRQRITETHQPGFYYYEEESRSAERIIIPHSHKDNLIDPRTETHNAAWAGDMEAVGAMLDGVEEGEELNFMSALMEYFKQRKTRAEVQRKILGE